MELCLPSVRYPSRSPFRNRTASIIRCAIAEPSGVPAPMGEKTQYKDGFFAKAFMTLFARKMEKFGSGNKGGSGRGLYDYESFVDVSKRVMQGRSRKEQQRVVREVLLSMLPPGAPAQFRKLFPPTRWAAEFNAALTVPFFDWLVGPSEVIEVEVNGVKQRSGVHIKKCRYLENSGCVGMCVNMCKLPTQDFFTNEFGLPLTMTPNFEDMSCEMVYGQVPPPFEEDPVAKQPCYANMCKSESRHYGKTLWCEFYRSNVSSNIFKRSIFYSRVVVCRFYCKSQLHPLSQVTRLRKYICYIVTQELD